MHRRLPAARIAQLVGGIHGLIACVVGVRLAVVGAAAFVAKLIHAVALAYPKNACRGGVADADGVGGALVVVIRIEADRRHHRAKRRGASR